MAQNLLFVETSNCETSLTSLLAVLHICELRGVNSANYLIDPLATAKTVHEFMFLQKDDLLVGHAAGQLSSTWPLQGRQTARGANSRGCAVAPGLLPLVGDPELACGLDLQQTGRHVAQGGQIRGDVPVSMPRVVLMEGDVEHVVQTILDAPM
jgi:hypothetical protein